MRYLLVLSDMRASQIEHSDCAVAWSMTPGPLEELLRAERVAPYQDHDGSYAWNKTFRKGGPLEWFNDFRGSLDTDKLIVEVPDPEEAANRARQQAEVFFTKMPEVR